MARFLLFAMEATAPVARLLEVHESHHTRVAAHEQMQYTFPIVGPWLQPSLTCYTYRPYKCVAPPIRECPRIARCI
ncbi:hypothetical protein BKA56DRAFT_586941 [Ilyonectria sp. MPI-CAGE-AT-0026]|nr:hypothetical protein BKA56DRAFT_586941 [Ilyonectria sp. MPI-CAGE-AT-0026]